MTVTRIRLYEPNLHNTYSVVNNNIKTVQILLGLILEYNLAVSLVEPHFKNMDYHAFVRQVYLFAII